MPADRSDRFDWAEDEEYDEEKLHRNSRDYNREDQWNFRCTGDVAVVEGGEYRVRYYTAVRPDRAADYGSIQETKTECFRIVNNAVEKFDGP